MYLYECFPLDYFYDFGILAKEWLTKIEEDYMDDSDYRNEKYKEALDMFLENYNEGELRNEPYVVYDIGNDAFCFIFKLENNGTTVVVSEYEMDYLNTIDGY